MKFKYFISVVLCMITGANLQGANQDWSRSEQKFTDSTTEFNAIARFNAMTRLTANVISNTYSNPKEYFIGKYLDFLNFSERIKSEKNQWRRGILTAFVRKLDADGLELQHLNGEFHTVYPNVGDAKLRLGLLPLKRHRGIERQQRRQRANEAAKNAGLGSHRLEISKECDGRAWLITTTETGRFKQPLITN